MENMNDQLIKKLKEQNVDLFDENIYSENKKLCNLTYKLETQEKQYE